jgi:hypothetical protein
MARFSRVSAAVLAAVVLSCLSASAQVTSSIQGRVTDASGAVVSGAKVRVINEATGAARTSESSPEGYYRIPDLLPGTYMLRIEQTGFRALLRRNVALAAQQTLNLDVQLEVGETSQSVEVTAAVPQVETTEARISTVVGTEEIRSLPALGRGLMWLAVTTPGISGKAEDGRTGQCCDVFSSLASPGLSSAGNERKAAFYLDGIALHYGDGADWNLAFSPSPDAVEEMRVSANPTSVDEGVFSGAQVQIVTKGGTNQFHGTGHYTFLDGSFNALPYGASSEDVGSWYQRYFGGTLGGAIIKDRLFFFGGYEGLRERRAAAGGQAVVVETEQFKDWVVKTRLNSIAAKLLQEAPPFRYATDNLVDVNGDGIPDIGTVNMDRPSKRTGDQYNIRVDYLTKSGKDRLYGTYWRNEPEQPILDVRPELDYDQKTGTKLLSLVHAHTFSPAALNELRFSTLWGPNWDWRFTKNRYDLPCIVTDDGLGFPSTFSGSCSYSYEVQKARPYDVKDTFSWTRGAHNWKFGGSFRHVYLTDPAYLYGDTPVYNFGNIIDFANDKPYQETRNVDGATGKLRNPFVEARNQQLAFFAQDSWRIRPGLTINLGLRWDYYSPFKVDGIRERRDTYALTFSTGDVTPKGVAALRNQKVSQSFDADRNNFGPRVSIVWDPTQRGRMAVRGGFYVLYDEINSISLYRNFYGNPPGSSLLSAGPQYGIPIVYGIAPKGTRDFPINPQLRGPAIDQNLGIYSGTRPGLSGYVKDFSQPLSYDLNVAVQRQIFNDLSAAVTYHFRKTTNDIMSWNANRFTGDLADGQLDRLNPHYDTISVFGNWGKRTYHGLILEATKRYSAGWQVTGSYTYNNAHSNYGGVTEAFNPQLDWARDEIGTHVFTAATLWRLPIFLHRSGFLGAMLGGWELSSIWNFQAGSYFNPVSRAAYGSGGDFNADGQRSDRPDRPAQSIPTSYSRSQWMKGAISASAFPRPDSIRNGMLPRNYFRGPGYARIDASFAKKFRLNERFTLEYQLQAANVVNHVNISGVQSSLTAANFGQASSFFPMRSVQMSFRVRF